MAAPGPERISPRVMRRAAGDSTPGPSVVENWAGLVKLHVLWQADHEPIYGAGVVSTLEERGFRLPTGTVYAILHALEAAHLLERGHERVVHGRRRKYYRATGLGRRSLARARDHLSALRQELDHR